MSALAKIRFKSAFFHHEMDSNISVEQNEHFIRLEMLDELIYGGHYGEISIFTDDSDWRPLIQLVVSSTASDDSLRVDLYADKDFLNFKEGALVESTQCSKTAFESARMNYWDYDEKSVLRLLATSEMNHLSFQLVNEDDLVLNFLHGNDDIPREIFTPRLRVVRLLTAQSGTNHNVVLTVSGNLTSDIEDAIDQQKLGIRMADVKTIIRNRGTGLNHVDF